MRHVPKEEYIERFRAPEGSVNFYYGRIGSGKTYAATADILDLLDKGQIVYANWRIDWPGVDESTSRIRRIVHYIFKRGILDHYSKENFHYIAPENATAAFLSTLTDCHVFIDEGQNLLDSYQGTDFSKEKRRLIQYTRHFHRTLNIIAQRPTSVQVTARAQVNRFFKCEQKWNPFWPRFVRKEYQDMVQENVDETADPISEKHYWGKKRVFQAYDSKYMRAAAPVVYPLIERYQLQPFTEGLRKLRALARGVFHRSSKMTPLRGMVPSKDKLNQGRSRRISALDLKSAGVQGAKRLAQPEKHLHSDSGEVPF